MKVFFKEEKETKNTIKFNEIVEELDMPKIGSLYVSKHALKEMGWKRGINIAVTLSL